MDNRYVLHVFCAGMCRPLHRLLALLGRKPLHLDLLVARDGASIADCCFMFHLRGPWVAFRHLLRQLEGQPDVLELQWQEWDPRRASDWTGTPRVNRRTANTQYCLID